MKSLEKVNLRILFLCIFLFFAVSNAAEHTLNLKLRLEDSIHKDFLIEGSVSGNFTESRLNHVESLTLDFINSFVNESSSDTSSKWNPICMHHEEIKSFHFKFQGNGGFIRIARSSPSLINSIEQMFQRNGNAYLNAISPPTSAIIIGRCKYLENRKSYVSVFFGEINKIRKISEGIFKVTLRGNNQNNEEIVFAQGEVKLSRVHN